MGHPRVAHLPCWCRGYAKSMGWGWGIAGGVVPGAKWLSRPTGGESTHSAQPGVAHATPQSTWCTPLWAWGPMAGKMCLVAPLCPAPRQQPHAGPHPACGQEPTNPLPESPTCCLAWGGKHHCMVELCSTCSCWVYQACEGSQHTLGPPPAQ